MADSGDKKDWRFEARVPVLEELVELMDAVRGGECVESVEEEDEFERVSVSAWVCAVMLM